MKSIFIKRNFKLHVRTCPVAAQLRPFSSKQIEALIYRNLSEPFTQVDLLQKGKIPGGAGLPPFPL